MGDTILLSHIGVEVRSSWKVQFQSVRPGQSTIYHRALLPHQQQDSDDCFVEHNSAPLSFINFKWTDNFAVSNVLLELCRLTIGEPPCRLQLDVQRSL